MIIADTSGLLAAMDPDEVHHAACRAVVEQEGTPLVRGFDAIPGVTRIA